MSELVSILNALKQVHGTDARTAAVAGISGAKRIVTNGLVHMGYIFGKMAHMGYSKASIHLV